MKRAEIDTLIDTLDRAERDHPEIWRKPLADLEESLGKAQRVRRWIASPCLALALAGPGLINAVDWTKWVASSWAFGSISLMLIQIALEPLFPALNREERIKSLKNYFSSWREYDSDLDDSKPHDDPA